MQTIKNISGNYSYVIGPYSDPVASVLPDETFIVETLDAFELPYVNPLTGPIFIEGAEKGDTLLVTINSIELTRDYAVSALIPEFGGLCSTLFTRSLQDPLPPRVMLHPITGDEMIFSEDLAIPNIKCEPFYGTIGTAPELEAITSSVSYTHLRAHET